MAGIAGMELLLEVVAIPAELLVVVLAELFKDILPSWESTKDWYSWKFRSSDFGFDLLLDFCWNLFVFLIFSVNICFSYVWGLQCIQALSLKLIYLLLVLAHIFQILHTWYSKMNHLVMAENRYYVMQGLIAKKRPIDLFSSLTTGWVATWAQQHKTHKLIRWKLWTGTLDYLDMKPTEI